MDLDQKLRNDFHEMHELGKKNGRLDALNQVLDILTEERIYQLPVYARIRKLLDEAMSERFHKEAA